MKFNELNYLGTRWKVGTKIGCSPGALPSLYPVTHGQIVNINKYGTISIMWENEKQWHNYNFLHVLRLCEIQ